jgi:hypothetical protein
MPMRSRWVGWAFGLGLVLVASGAAAQVTGYRWVDERGDVHYAGRRDQVPEQYRSQLAPEGPTEPPKPRLPEPPATARGPESGECLLRFRGTAARPGASRSYPSCEACRKALALLRGEEAARAECIASSVKSYR